MAPLAFGVMPSWDARIDRACAIEDPVLCNLTVTVLHHELVVPVHQRGRGAGSGVEVGRRMAYFIALRDGKLTEWRLFDSKESAMQHAATL